MLLLPALVAVAASMPQVDTAGAEREAARYAAEHLLSPLSAGRRAFDPSVHVGYARAPQRSRELAQLLQANLAARDSVIVCGTSRGSCTMPGFSALVSLQVESMDDSTAEVSVTVEQPSGMRRIPIYLTESTLRFSWTGSSWQFVRVARMRST